MKMRFVLTLCVCLLAVLKLQTVDCKLTMEQKLENLRKEMVSANCQALIIPSEDEHQSEYVAEYDMRRAWITDFTGSSGTAVVTASTAALWTDSRYYIQAGKQLDSKFWQLMKASEADTISIEAYLADKVQSGGNVCANAKLVSISTWKSRDTKLKSTDLSLVDSSDLIDKTWPKDERPPKPASEIFVHPLAFAGLEFMKKIELVQQKIVEAKADFFVVTELDEVAWLFNMRASDIPYNPMFFAYAIISGTGNDHRLYVDPTNRTNFETLKTDHLAQVSVRAYTSIVADLQELSKQNRTIWISPSSSYAIYNAVTNKDLFINNKLSPVRDLKSIKSQTELVKTRECQIRDSAARIRHMYQLEKDMNAGVRITEKSAASMLENIQAEDDLFRSLSFESISAVGKNAAIVHYATSEGDDSVLTKDKVYLLDAGAQYFDCTTDITRTLHFGEPNDEEVSAYTRVMQGSVNLASMVFPDGILPNILDVEARLPLWRVGLDYGHGTGHGIGYYLSVHEAPPSIAYNSRATDPIRVGMISSDEPGFYVEGKFGIRLETDIEVVEVPELFNVAMNKKTLKFEAQTLVPFETKLIDVCMLTEAQIKYLNEYNSQTRAKVLPVLGKYPEVQDYLRAKTEPMDLNAINQQCRGYYNGASAVLVQSKTGLFVLSGLTVLIGMWSR